VVHESEFSEVEAVVAEDEPESLSGCNKINQLRVAGGFKPMQIVLKKSDRIVSSTLLREWVHSSQAFSSGKTGTLVRVRTFFGNPKFVQLFKM